jgi:hypothetical protein
MTIMTITVIQQILDLTDFGFKGNNSSVLPLNSPVDIPVFRHNSPVDIPALPHNSPIDIPVLPRNSPIDIPVLPRNSPIDIPVLLRNSPVDIPVLPRNSPVDMSCTCTSSVCERNAYLVHRSFYRKLHLCCEEYLLLGYDAV